MYSFFTSTGEEMFCTDYSPQFLNTGFVIERVLMHALWLYAAFCRNDTIAPILVRLSADIVYQYSVPVTSVGV